MVDAAEAIRRVLAAVAEGELDVSTPGDLAAVRRLEGAIVALEKTAGKRPKKPAQTP